MNVLLACEFSGIGRDAFRRRGHHAWSCDVLPCEGDPEWHFQCDVRKLLSPPPFDLWDLIIAFPPCTYLCNSGVRWLHTQPGRWDKMRAGAEFFNYFKGKAKHVVIENPIPHGYARKLIGNYQQIIQPWQFGHGETKATALQLHNVPKLVPTKVVEGRTPRVHHASPGPDRWKERSRLLPGYAEAFAEQWGALAA